MIKMQGEKEVICQCSFGKMIIKIWFLIKMMNN